MSWHLSLAMIGFHCGVICGLTQDLVCDRVGRMYKSKYAYGQPTLCETCGKRFTPRARHGRFCCRGCAVVPSNKARTIHHIRPCEICGEGFKPIRAERKCCSRECGTIYRLRNRTPNPQVAIRHKLAVFCCGLIARCLRNKTGRTTEMLGYTTAALKYHLESQFENGMTWANYGKRKGCWSIDHIKMISPFDSQATMADINALSNLRPLWHSQNASRQWNNQ